MEKNIQNADTFAHKLRLALIKVINHKLELVRKEQRKRKEIVKSQKTETMTTRRQKARRGISLSSEEEKNYESDTEDETDPN